MRDVLLEIGTEEMPHEYVVEAINQINKMLPKLLNDMGIVYGNYDVYGTPRRISLYISGIIDKQAVKEEEIKGPPLSVAYKDGNPTNALLGFLRKNGASLEDVYSKKVNKGEYVFVKIKKGGKDVKELFPDVFRDLVLSLKFPKMMRWGEGAYQFGRPVRWIVALYGNQILPVSMFGLNAGNISRGLRVFSGEVYIDKAEDYMDIMERQGYVIVDQNARKTMIRDGILEAARAVDGVPDIDEDLLEEVNYLVEYPTPFMGKIDEEFLTLPEIVVITVMKHHQRYFPVRDKDGKLLPYFIGIRNGLRQGLENVIRGNERVIRARLYDAVFFFNEDRKRSLESWREDTATIPFFENMGTYLDKSERVKKLVNTPDQKKIAHLIYADLPTNMVREFTELHGYMGKEYYKEKDEKVAQGILDTIFPLYGQLPETVEGAYVGLMDRLDTLAVAAIKGIKIRGGGDIFGIRRAGVGIITLLDRYFPYLVWKEIAKQVAQSTVEFFNGGDVEKIYEYMTEVVKGRLRNYFGDIPYEILMAASEGWEEKPFGQIRSVSNVLKKLLDKDRDTILKITLGYKRIVNILKDEKDLDRNVDPVGEWEIKLYDKSNFVSAEIDSLTLYKEDDVKRAVKLLLDLSLVLDKFFEEVLVNHEDINIRKRRKALLNLVGNTFKKVASFSKIGL